MAIDKRRLAAFRVRQTVVVVLLLFFQAASANAQAPKPAAAQIRILFIGNSLTYVNDLPAELRAMVAVAYPSGPALRYEQVTPPGCTLQKHWNDGKAAAKIAEGHWDYVIVQEQ
jgi:hypothetical protein